MQKVLEFEMRLSQIKREIVEIVSVGIDVIKIIVFGAIVSVSVIFATIVLVCLWIKNKTIYTKHI